MTEYDFDESIVSDLHKDAYGFRPRSDFWEHWAFSTDDQKQKIWDDLVDELQCELERISQEHARAIAEFEKRVDCNLIYGAIDRTTAIRWIFECEGLDHADLSYACYHLDLPYSYEPKLKHGENEC